MRMTAASLSKESLVNLLTTLVTTTPSLRPLVTSLLPAPTLSATLSTLAHLERKVLNAIPAGGAVREDYIWGRVRLPLEEYLSESRGFLNAFCGSNTANRNSTEDEIGHPSTTFAFLYALTSSLRRLEASLPPLPSLLLTPNYPIEKRYSQDLLTTHLLPLLINHWQRFLTGLSMQVNSEGRILSGEVLRGWLKRLEELCVESPGVREGTRREGGARKACEGVRDRLKRDLGWLIGVKAEPEEEEMDEEEL